MQKSLIAIKTKKSCLLPGLELDVVREFIEPDMSRCALDRLLHRRSHSRLPVPTKPEGEHKPFKVCEPAYVHVDVKYLPQMQDGDKRRYVAFAIDRAMRWVFIAIKLHKTAISAKAFLAAVRKAVPFKIGTILTNKGKEFTDRSPAANPQANTSSISCAKCCTPATSTAPRI